MARSTTIPDAFQDLVRQKVSLAHLATIMPDGTPQVTPVWFDVSGERIRVNTARGRVKDRNMSHNAAVALSIVDPENPYRHIAIRGRVVHVTEQGADAHIDALAKKYLGTDTYPRRKPGEVRVIYEIEPTSVSTMG
jgi:PPOX class probable F420-dependent enzyme